MHRIRIALAAVVAALAVVLPAGTASAAAEITIGTHNTLRGDASFERFAGVIGWQEVESVAARDKLRARLGAEYKTYWAPDDPARSIPISYRADRFTLLSSGSVRTHPGEAGVTPARYVNWVVLQVAGSGPRLIVVNTHFISGAWSGKPERQARWLRHRDVIKAEVATLRARHPDLPLFVVGDFNRAQAVSFAAPVEWVPVQGVSGTPIDHMYAPSTIPHSKVTRLDKWGSDHFAYRLSATV
ncbi:hypothetical protein ACOBQX_01095 [Actinokineospora sp. G85]|uniref:hypothetical protein n=1 Tax=Actinokineospora sp. G85 TaxID=3406626 RepID=UPI003C772E5A